MKPRSLDLSIVKGEDYSAYLQMTDQDGKSAITDAFAVPKLQIAKPDGKVLLAFLSTGNTMTQATIVVLGTSGYIRITCPRALTSTLAVGRYQYDMTLDHSTDPQPVFSTKQREFALSGFVTVYQPASPFTL